jgi:hypothetical protein
MITERDRVGVAANGGVPIPDQRGWRAFEVITPPIESAASEMDFFGTPPNSLISQSLRLVGWHLTDVAREGDTYF